MRARRYRISVLVSAAALVVTLLAVAGSGPAAASKGAPKPTYGGTLSFVSANNLTTTLDPNLLLGGGTVGNIELQAIYDTIVAWNPTTRKYVLRTAQSLKASDNYTVWTLKLRPHITFTDGTPYDGEAVVYNINRQLASTSKAPDHTLLVNFIKSMTLVGGLTVRFTLTESWTSFPYLLSREAGMIASPTQIEELGTNFGSAVSPAGAGPFEEVSYTPADQLVLKRNPHYYGPKPYLSGLTFVAPPTDPAVTEQEVLSDQVGAAYILDPTVAAKGHADGLGTLVIPAEAGNSIALNDGLPVTCASGQPAPECTGQANGAVVASNPPTANLNIRKAIAMAVSPEIVNQRVYEGDAEASSALFAKGFPWFPNVPGPSYDPSAAMTLVSQAKAAGYNGNLNLLVQNTPAGVTWGETVGAMLQAVGFNVTTTVAATSQVVSQVLIQHNYQLAEWGLSISADDGTFGNLFTSFASASDRYGYSSPAMDAALAGLRNAVSDKDRIRALKHVEEIMNEAVPAVFLLEVPQTVIFNKKVHGIAPTSYQSVILSGAWISK